MPNDHNTENLHQPGIYQVRLKGILGPEWAGWFEGMAVTRMAGGDTLLTGPVADQAALHGLLKKVRDLGLPLVSVCPVQPGGEGGCDLTTQNPIP